MDLPIYPFLDYTKCMAHAAYKRGDMALILTWFNGKRAAYLLPTRKKNKAHLCQQFIPYKAVQKLDDDVFMERACALAAERIGMQGQEARIARFLRDHLPEMHDMSLIEPAVKKCSRDLFSWSFLCAVEEGEDFANDAGA